MPPPMLCVVSLMVVVIDEGFNLRFEISRQEVVLQQDSVLQCLVPSFDLALRLRMIRRATNVTHPVITECLTSAPMGQI